MTRAGGVGVEEPPAGIFQDRKWKSFGAVGVVLGGVLVWVSMRSGREGIGQDRRQRGAAGAGMCDAGESRRRSWAGRVEES